MILPNFLIIGAPKCGTTSLYAYLRQHPHVFMSTPKEPTFFGNEGTDGLFHGPHDEDRAYHSRVITNFADYTALFDRVTKEEAIGEASIYSLYLPKAPMQGTYDFLYRFDVSGTNAPPPMPQDVRSALLEEYRNDILRLGDLLHRDLSHWCSVVLAAVGQAMIFFWMNNCEELI